MAFISSYKSQITASKTLRNQIPAKLSLPIIFHAGLILSFKLEFLNLGTTDTLGSTAAGYGDCLCIVGCLAASMASTH